MDTNTRLKEIAQYRMMIAQAQAELEKVETEVKEYMVANNLEEIMSDEHRATYKPVTSNRFDSGAFRKEYEELYESYKTPQTSMRFTFA